MAQITIGKTGLRVEQNCFGALPIQRISKHDAVYLLRKAYDGGVNYYDSARGYSLEFRQSLKRRADAQRNQVP